MKPIVRSLAPPPLLAGTLAFGLAIALWASPALALTSGTASNTAIQNTATVAYNDAGGAVQTPVPASSTITVALVASAPNISASTPASPVSSTPSATVTLTYTITNTANGPDSYTLTTGVTQTNITGSTATPNPAAAFTLGASSLAATYTAGAATVTVPWDGSLTTDTTAINGLRVGSVIVIGGSTCTITSISKSASTLANNVAVIGVSTGGAGGACGAGALNAVVPEQKTVTVTVNTGSLTVGNNSGTDVVTLTGTGSGPAGSSPATTINVTRPALTVTKLVQVDPGGAAGTCAGTFGAIASGPPGATLCYKVTATNGGAGAATAVQFTDVVPVYLTYVNGSGKFATAAATPYGTAGGLTEGLGGYSYTPGTTTVNYNPGGATGTVAGTVPGPAGVLVLFFKATIN